jgi:hypothetical protein
MFMRLRRIQFEAALVYHPDGAPQESGNVADPKVAGVTGVT